MYISSLNNQYSLITALRKLIIILLCIIMCLIIVYKNLTITDTHVNILIIIIIESGCISRLCSFQPANEKCVTPILELRPLYLSIG